jgi:hypothetical protein
VLCAGRQNGNGTETAAAGDHSARHGATGTSLEVSAWTAVNGHPGGAIVGAGPRGASNARQEGRRVTTSEVRVITRYATAMRYAILALQVESGDRVDDPRFLIRNKTDEQRGRREISEEEYENIRQIVRKLVDAARERAN